MAELGVYLKLDQKTLFRNDFSDEDAQRFSGTIYSDRALATAFNITGYTLTIQFYKEWHSTDYFNKTATINVAASGTWYREITDGDIPQAGIYLVKLKLTKSGTQLSTKNRQELLVKDGAA